MGKTRSYEENFSGRTRAIINTLTNIFIDSGLDIRHKHMFGHKAFLYRGHVFLLVGEWARQEKRKDRIVLIAEKGRDEPTLIVIPPDEAMAEGFRRTHGGLYFAPSGTRLKNWLSFTGEWLSDEERVQPVVQELLKVYGAMPPKTPKNAGLSV